MIASNAMDVLAPPLIWVEGGCYRFYETCASPSEDADIRIASVRDLNRGEFVDLDDEPSSEDSDVPVREEPCDRETVSAHTDVIPIERDVHDGETSGNIDVINVGKNRYQHTFTVDRTFFPRIVGPKGSTLLQLQFDTETSIKIPSRETNCSNIVITGSKRETVVSARQRLDLLFKNFKKQNAYTHFLSIPLTDKTIVANYNKFKTVVLNENARDSQGVRKELFKKPEKLHLCIGMLMLENDEEIKAAIRTLQECNEKIIKPIIQKNGPVIIKAEGLSIPIDNPNIMVNALSGNVLSKNNMLRELADKILHFFVVRGLMTKPRERLRTRMGLMNVVFNNDLRKPGDRSRGQFYPKNILMKHGNYFFGETVLKSIHLSKRGSYDANGYYATVSKISLFD